MSQNPPRIYIDNPYEHVDWDSCHYVDSMSHQHSIGDAEECEAFYKMGYRHFAFSCYYPSTPVPSLPAEFAERHPDVIFSPNAEHHSFTDSGLHLNGLGSFFSSGYGQTASPPSMSKTPLIAHFDDIRVNEQSNSIYRLDIILGSRQDAEKPATLSIDGAVKCDSDNSRIRDLPVTAGRHQIYLRAEKEEITATLNYGAEAFTVRQFRLMQGTNRPWREVFRDVLDQLQYADGGGITLNHPAENAEHYLPMLDFDPRVLGTEVWNYRRGFGNSLHYYRVWDDILRTGRRCWGFFVKDHYVYERGRNVLLLPNLSEQAALRAYRNGTFFGSIAAAAVDNNGNMTVPFDKSTFRFTRIAIRRDKNNNPSALEVSVAGQNSAKRPNVQIRFITANGIEKIADADSAEFSLEMDEAAFLTRRFIRVEAFAYPDSYGEDIPLDKSTFSKMDVGQIAALHNKKQSEESLPSISVTDKVRPWNAIGHPTQFRNTVPVADMLFSQPLRFLKR